MSDHLPEYIVMTRLICRPQGATIYEMADSLGKDVKTARNRLRELTFMFPLYSEPDPGNGKILRYKTLSHSKTEFLLPDMTFSDEEKDVFRMFYGSANMTPALEIQTKRLFNKLSIMAAERGSLIKAGANEPVPIVNAQTIVPKSVDNKALHRKINQLLKAIADRNWIRFSYRKMDSEEPFTMELYPIMVFISHRNPYVYCFNRKEEIRMIAVERIESINYFFEDIHPACDMALLKDMLSDPFGVSCETQPYEVKLLITPYQAPYEKEKQWPKGKVSFTDTEEGTIMTAVTRTIFDVRRYILKRTPYIKVLSPQWLKDSVLDHLQRGISTYQS